MDTIDHSKVEAAIAGSGHLIGGEIVHAGTPFAVIDPATEEQIGEAPAASVELVDAAAQAAAAAAPEWGRDEAGRRAAITEMADRIASNAELLAHVVSLENGKPITLARGEVGWAEMHARHWAAAEIPVDMIYDDQTQRVTVERFPVGVVAAITPWNGPIVSLVNKLACALLVGNTVVGKPSPFTPLSTLILGSLLTDVFPPGVVNLLAGGDATGAALVVHPHTNAISFTGGIGAGRAIARAAADDLKRVCLELGGNDAAIVLGDVDVDAVAPKLYRGAFAMSGQVCAAVKRLFVHASIHDQMVERLAMLADQAKVGGPFEPGVTMGPLTTPGQFERVRGLVEDAVAAGGEAVTGGRPLERSGYFYPATVISGVAPGTRIVDEEQFGPALPIISFDAPEDALAAANATSYGLGGSIWTNDTDTGLRLARRLESGSAWVNRHPAVGPNLPFGGFKHSGIGRENGRAGIDNLAELKTVSIEFGGASSAPAG